jgi:hypothetical protein
MIQPFAVAELRRELGKWDLTAIGINQVIGGAVFAMPASVAALAGGWSPYLIVAVGIASLMIAATFAEVGSRFDATGGPYLYTKTAFGRFPAFEIGWMQWFTRVASWASVINVLVASLGYYWPAVTTGPARTALLTAIIATLAFINVLGIRQSAWVVNALTIGKLVPLAVFIAFGLPAIDPSRLSAGALPPLSDLSKTALLLIFAYGGYEVVPVPAGESKDPRRAVPFALIMTIVVVTIILALAQVVSLGTLPNLPGSKTPLADASVLFLGAGGAALITLGAVFSTLGNNMGRRCRARAACSRWPSRAICPRVRQRQPPLRHAGRGDSRSPRRLAGAGDDRLVRHDGAGERGEPPGRVRGDVRLRAAPAERRVRRPRARPADARAARPRDPAGRDRHRPHDPVRAPPAAAAGRRLCVVGGRRAVFDRGQRGWGQGRGPGKGLDWLGTQPRLSAPAPCPGQYFSLTTVALPVLSRTTTNTSS